MAVDQPPHMGPAQAPQHVNSDSFSPVYDVVYSQENQPHGPHGPMNAMAPHFPHLNNQTFLEADQIWRGLEQTSAEQLPVWISDQSLGGQSFSQHGMDAFIIPNEYLPPTTQIW